MYLLHILYSISGVYSCVEVNLDFSRHAASYIMQWYVPCMFLVIIAFMSEIVVATEFLGRLLLVLIPLISLCMFSILYTIFTSPPVTYTRPIDIFSGTSLFVIFCQLIRIMVLQYYAQKKIRVSWFYLFLVFQQQNFPFATHCFSHLNRRRGVKSFLVIPEMIVLKISSSMLISSPKLSSSDFTYSSSWHISWHILPSYNASPFLICI